MRRRLGMLAVVSSAVLVLPPSPQPAQAHAIACVANSTMTLDTGFGLFGITGPQFANFTMSFTLGTCALPVQNETWTGWVYGNCGLASGELWTSTGHTARFTIQGDTMTVHGPGAFGTATWTEDPMDQGSCVNTTAHNFLTTGTWAS